MSATRPLRELAKVIRSKNAGPFEVTFDVIFDSDDTYRRVKASGALSRERMASLYGVASQQILVFEFFDVARALKFTIPRPRPQGSVGETDMHAAQQHVPLMFIEIPWSDDAPDHCSGATSP